MHMPWITETLEDLQANKEVILSQQIPLFNRLKILLIIF